MSVGSDDSGSSDLTSYYCIGCDTWDELGPDAPPFVCGVKYSSDEESIGNDNDIIRLPAARVARYQISAIDPVTGVEILSGRNTGHDAEASGSNAGATITVTQEEWNAAQGVVVNNTPSLLAYRKAPSTPTTPSLREIEFGLPRSEQNSTGAGGRPIFRVSVGQNSRLSEASAPRAISTAASTDRSSRASQRGTQPISNQTSPTPS
jgi:hypothetical protein